MFYHVQITPKTQSSTGGRFETDLNLSSEDLETRFLTPYRSGNPIIVRGRTILANDLERIRIFRTERELGRIDASTWRTIPEVTGEFITRPPGSSVEFDPRVGHQARPDSDAREIVVVHGRNYQARDALFLFLRSIDLHPLEWTEAIRSTGRGSPYIGNILDAMFSRAHAVVVLFTPDDEARLKEQFRDANEPPYETELYGQARPNVLFEAGMSMGRYPDRTILVELGTLRPFSDISGIHVVRLDNSPRARHDLVERLRTAGCPVNSEGTDWYSTGDFELSVSNQLPDSSAQINDTQEEIGFEPGPDLSEDEVTLLLNAANHTNGTILKLKTLGGTFIRVNGEVWGDPHDRRSIARWESAIRGLLGMGFIEDPNGTDNSYKVTHEGFVAEERLQRSSDT